jgi:septation ring formation regulator EzrA
MNIDFDKLSDKQRAYVSKYAVVHKKLTKLQKEMTDIEKRISETIEELEQIRINENKLLNNGKEK